MHARVATRPVILVLVQKTPTAFLVTQEISSLLTIHVALAVKMGIILRIMFVIYAQ